MGRRRSARRPSGRFLPSAAAIPGSSADRRRRRARRRLGGLIGLLVLAAATFAFARIRDGSEHAARAAGRPGRPPALSRDIARRAARAEAAVDRTLRRTSYLVRGGTHRRDIALTFDDGPSPFTHRIVNVLRRTHTPATFFVVGRWARTYPRVIALEARDGFQIGDHTENHAFLSVLSHRRQLEEIIGAARAIRRAGAPAPVLFRPPYGAFDRQTRQILRAHELLMVLWSVDTSDYTRPGVKRIVRVALAGARPGAVILMHDGGGDRSQTVAALPRIIAALRHRGYRLRTVPELVLADPPPRHQPAPQPLSGIG
jgi:peptidoglycan/xylan/chitin deacetylase (PgdA/CDA1 family)